MDIIEALNKNNFEVSKSYRQIINLTRLTTFIELNDTYQSVLCVLTNST